LFSQLIPSNNLGFIDSSQKSLEIDIGSRTLTIKQSPGLLNSDRSGGTTGAVLWKITPLVSEWLSQWPNGLTQYGLLHPDAVVVELGCGIAGVIGVMLAPMVSTYLLTDQAYVSRALHDNINANTQSSVIKQRSGKKRSAKDVDMPPFLPLDWETDDAANILPHLPDGRPVDLVVVCDCVYNDHLIRPLVNILTDVCKLKPPDTRPTYALIAQQLRSNDVMEQFLSALMEKFTVWRIPPMYLPAQLQSDSGYAVHLARLRG
jgi:hypothetical protein